MGSGEEGLQYHSKKIYSLLYNLYTAPPTENDPLLKSDQRKEERIRPSTLSINTLRCSKSKVVFTKSAQIDKTCYSKLILALNWSKILSTSKS